MALGELKNGIGPDAYAIYQQVLAAVVERDHPVGSLYISENATSPAELYGGTWERIEGKFIMGASDTYPAGSTGGSATHTQTQDEIAMHRHIQSMQDGLGSFSRWVSGSSGGNYGYVSNINTEYVGSGSTVVTTENSGNNNPMDILNPYYSMYIWRRVA